LNIIFQFISYNSSELHQSFKLGIKKRCPSTSNTTYC